MASAAVTYTFQNAATIIALQFNTNYSDIINYINARNSGGTKWEGLATSGTLSVDGASTLAGAVALSSTLAVTGAATLSSTLAVTGATTLSALTSVTGANTDSNATTGVLYFNSASTNNKIIRFAGNSGGSDFILYEPASTFALRLGKTDGITTTDLITFGSSGQITASTITATTQLLGKGTATNDSAASGYIGEVISSSDTSYGNMASTGTWADITSISLTAGDWDVYGTPCVSYNSANFSGSVAGAISTNSGNTTTDHVEGSNQMPIFYPLSTNTSAACTIVYRMSLSTTTNVYLKTVATYTGGPPQTKGTIWARRAR